MKNSPLTLAMERVLVVGAGTMGQGIAQWMVQQGLQVELMDTFGHTVEKAQREITNSWDRLLEKKKFQTAQIDLFKKNLTFHRDLKSLHNCPQLVIEAISEDLNLKTKLFSQLSDIMSPEVIFSTNTSGLSVTEIGKCLSPERRTHFLGLHFFNPATLMPLIEMIDGPWTDSQVSQALFNWFKNKGKNPVLCKDRPGFIVNRLNRNFYGEALRMAESFRPLAFKEIDLVMREVGGFMMGPFELMDMIGIDINFSVTQTLWKDFFYDPRFAPHHLQEQMEKSGRLGRKTGEGFFQYEK